MNRDKKIRGNNAILEKEIRQIEKRNKIYEY